MTTMEIFTTLFQLDLLMLMCSMPSVLGWIIDRFNV